MVKSQIQDYEDQALVSHSDGHQEKHDDEHLVHEVTNIGEHRICQDVMQHN